MGKSSIKYLISAAGITILLSGTIFFSFFCGTVPCAVGASEQNTTSFPINSPDIQSAANSQPETVAPETFSMPQPVYEYQLAGRPDPFKPFIAPKTVNPNEIVDDNRELTGMQLFEPGQLNLVAIMDTPGGRIAMVEDVTKKGYLLREGILIGRNGEVTEIMKDQVVVTETAHTRGGEQIKTVVSMKLKRDGESQ